MASLVKRNQTYYIQDRFAGKIKRTSLKTDSLQIAREKLRQYQSARARGLDNPLPTRTPIGEIVGQYVDHIRTKKTAKSAQTGVYYLREAFGAVCPQLEITSRRTSDKTRKRPATGPKDRRHKLHVIEANCLEEVTTADVQRFIDSHVRSRGLAPKTANRYREILCRLFNWSMKQGLVRLPGGRNPVAAVEPFKERAPEIRYLALPQIDEQLLALRFKPQLQCMVAMLIYGGLRREELLWLTLDDVELQRRANSGAGVIRIRAKTIATAAGERSWQPKTRSNRAVPISRALRSYLDRYQPPASDPASGAAPSGGWFFPAPSGGWWDPDNFSADLCQANRDAGLQWACLEDRHTPSGVGSQLAQNGVSLYKISTLMGNSPEICRRHYAALVPESMGAEVEFQTSWSRSCGEPLEETRRLLSAD